MRKHWYRSLRGITALTVLAGLATPAIAAVKTLPELTTSLQAKGFSGELANPKEERLMRKQIAPLADLTITVWMAHESGNDLSDAQQVKFSASRCADVALAKSDFFTQAETEAAAVYGMLTGQNPPKQFASDFQKMSYDPISYKSPGFRTIRLKTMAMKCDTHGGDSVELDFFPTATSH